MDKDFGVGDVVRLVTGGPNMVVVSIGKGDGDKHIFNCRWFERGVIGIGFEEHNQGFPLLALEHAPNEDEAPVPGSVVRLKNGDLEMVVMSASLFTADCIWVDRDGHIQTHQFYLNTINFVR